jgi:hypothetical protein
MDFPILVRTARTEPRDLSLSSHWRRAQTEGGVLIHPAMTAHETVEIAKASLAVWQKYPIPVLTEYSTESERIWRHFLLERRIAFNTLNAQ